MSTFANPNASPSMSKNDDNLSNSDRPLIKQNFNQNNNIVSSTKSRGASKNTVGHSQDDDEIPARKRYCLWMLTAVLASLGLCNLLLSVTIMAVLRMSQGMESMEVIPEENLIKFYGKTDLDQVCLQTGVCQGYGDSPMEVSGDGAGVQINLKRRPDHPSSSIQVLANGTSISRVKSMEIKDPHTGTVYFSSSFPNFELPSKVEHIDIKIAQTRRITSKVEENLSVESRGSIFMHGAEGTRMDSKEIIWTADRNITLESRQGSIILSAEKGISIDMKSIPVVPGTRSRSSHYKVCVCMPQGKLFRVPVPDGNVRVNCADNMTMGNNPCI